MTADSRPQTAVGFQRRMMGYKFEKLEVWQFGLEYVDLIFALADQLPQTEEFNLKSQIRRAATSITLNIAEGSTGQTDAEQTRFLGMAVRSLVETVACLHFINRRRYLPNPEPLRTAYSFSEKLFAKLQAFRTALKSGHNKKLNEEPALYICDESLPF